MSDYLHGAYGEIQSVGSRVADDSQGAFVYIGTAPVNQVAGGAANVNKPIVVRNIAEARKYFGYSDDWASFTLCEAMHAHLENKGVGPLVFINVLDPETHKASSKTTVSKTPANGRITISEASLVYLDSVVVKTTDETPETKVKGTDYSIAYSVEKEQIVIQELTSGALGTAALTVEYYLVTPSSVTDAVVVGSTDGAGLNTGVYAVGDVYTLTGYIPSFLAAPGFSSHPTVHNAMYAMSQKINGHWDAYMFVDLPIVSGGTQLTLATAATWKTANGYDKPNETVYFPMALGTDDNTYHLSVLAAANFQELLLTQDGIPFKTASNTACEIIENLYLGAEYTDRVYNDEIINAHLNKNGIASAAFVGGRWAIWGAHSAEYNQTDGDDINASETNMMMLYYISNDFQARRILDVDRPMSGNDIRTIVSEEQTRIDALLKIGALIFGEVYANATEEYESDIMNGDYSFTINVTTTPLAKSLTAIVTWTDEGFVTYYEIDTNSATDAE